MKRYNINWRNGLPFFLQVLGYAVSYAFLTYCTIITLIGFWLFGIAMLILLIGASIPLGKRAIIGLTNCIYFDKNNQIIILKLIGREKVNIPISSIGRICPKINEDPRKGAITTVSEGSRSGEVKQKTFAVQDTESNDLFYICKDTALLNLFESLGVEIIYNEE